MSGLPTGGGGRYLRARLIQKVDGSETSYELNWKLIMKIRYTNHPSPAGAEGLSDGRVYESANRGLRGSSEGLLCCHGQNASGDKHRRSGNGVCGQQHIKHLPRIAQQGRRHGEGGRGVGQWPKAPSTAIIAHDTHRAAKVGCTVGGGGNRHRNVTRLACCSCCGA